MNAPTRGPNQRFAAGSPREPEPAPRKARLLAWARCAALSYLLFAAPAAADAPLRITGTLTIDASASRHQSMNEVQARLLDDAGHPVAGADLQVKPLGLSSTAWTTRECRSLAPEVPANPTHTYLARTDGSGAACVRFDGLPERAEFEIEFSDPNGLYAPVNRTVVADNATRGVEMAFAPAPSVLALEREFQTLSIATRPHPALALGDALERIALSLTMARDGLPPRRLGESPVEIGSDVEFRIPSRAFGTPGPLEIAAEFSGSASTRAARAVALVTCTALTELSLAEPVAASHPEAGVRVRVHVTSVAGPVPSGSVEARSGNVSFGSARVAAGAADLYVQVDEALARARPIELRYVADSPWWLPAQPLSVQIPILPPSPWRRVAWIAAVSALGAWLLLGWQRPRRIERAATIRPPRAPRAAVDLVEVGDARAGWHGRVLDAHDGTPLGGALIALRLPAFDGQGLLRTAHSGQDGAFALEGVPLAGRGAALEVRAPWHTPLSAPMPPPGHLILSLVSRRRTLLARFIAWTGRDGDWKRRGEPTPGEVARRAARPEVAGWARAVDEAAYGPDPLSETKEQGVVGREPAQDRKPS